MRKICPSLYLYLSFFNINLNNIDKIVIVITMSWGNFGTEASERINWSRIREDRKRRAVEKMKEAGLGAFLAFYEENIRFISSTRGAPWTRDKPGLRYALLPLNGKVIMY